MRDALPSRLLRLMLIDADPVFRLGLRLGLAPFRDLELVTEASDSETALQLLADRFSVTDVAVVVDIPPDASSDPSVPDPSVPDQPADANPNLTAGIDLVLLDVGLGRADPNQIQGLTLCQQIKAQYPDVPVLLLSANPEPIVLAAAQQAGASGYCAKTADVPVLVAAIRQAAGRDGFFAEEGTAAAGSAENLLAQRQQSPETLPRSQTVRPSPFSRLLQGWRISGNRQIDRALAEINASLQDLDLAAIDRAVLAGQSRELRAARWVLNRLLPPVPSAEELQDSLSDNLPGNLPGNLSGHRSGTASPAPSPAPALPNAGSSALTLSGTPSALALPDSRTVQSIVFDAVFAKLQTSLTNQSDVPLETDLLREDKKRELFYLILRKLEDLLSELRYSQASPGLLEQKRSSLLLDLWQNTTSDFFGRYATLNVDGIEFELVSVLLQEEDTVQTAILDKIPGVVDLLSHLLFQTPLVVESTPYPAGNPESLARTEILLENLVVQVANAVIQPLLNRFANVEAIKQSFYDRRLLSTREVERFRNNLSWRYRLQRLYSEPKDIFESQHRLFVFTGRSIKQIPIYAPRNPELVRLSGIPFFVTLALETRDAVAPRVRNVVAFVGNGLIYVLTNVIGRGIGLIGRGIVEGIGNVVQDDRPRK
jgi:DNA-binding NarL/FixJ family response regulator